MTRFGQGLLLGANMLLPGLYAWTVTVAYPVSQAGAPPWSRFSAGAAIVFLATGSFLALSQPRLGRALGVLGFVAMCLVSWALLGPLVSLTEINVVRAGLGSVGWVLFAFGWGTLRNWGAVPEEDPHVVEGPTLVARGALPWGAAPILGFGALSAGTLMLFAWRVSRPVPAILAQGLALSGAVWLLTVASQIAVQRTGKRATISPRLRLKTAAVPLGGLCLLLLLGLLSGILP